MQQNFGAVKSSLVIGKDVNKVLNNIFNEYFGIPKELRIWIQIN